MNRSQLKQTLKRAFPEETRVVRLPIGIGRGLRLGLDLQEGHIGLYLGLYEVELNHLRRLCYPGARSFDIGYDALVMAKLSRADVVSVEADRELCQRIVSSVEANPGLVGPASVVCAYVGKPGDLPGRVTIDELARGHIVPDFLKIGFEGGEADALVGAAVVLRERHPGQVVGVHSASLERECLQILDGHGYEPVVVDQRRLFRDHRPLAHNRWLVASSWPRGDGPS